MVWYVGGNNIRIIDDIDEIELSKPIYYSCDWDLTGLQIYTRIKEKLKNRNRDISILYPNEFHKKISTYIDYHYNWDVSKELSGLPIPLFSKKESILINNLIQSQMWIEEESFDLIEMLDCRMLTDSTNSVNQWE